MTHSFAGDFPNSPERQGITSLSHWARDEPQSAFKLPTTIWLLHFIAAFCTVDPQMRVHFPGLSWCHFCSVFGSRVFQSSSHGQPRAVTTVWTGVGGRSSGLLIKYPMASEGSITLPIQCNYLTHTHTNTSPQGLSNSCYWFGTRFTILGMDSFL